MIGVWHIMGKRMRYQVSTGVCGRVRCKKFPMDGVWVYLIVIIKFLAVLY